MSKLITAVLNAQQVEAVKVLAEKYGQTFYIKDSWEWETPLVFVYVYEAVNFRGRVIVSNGWDHCSFSETQKVEEFFQVYEEELRKIYKD